MSHDRYLLDRVSTQVIALDGRGGAQHFADYDQWEANRETPAASSQFGSRQGAAKKERARDATVDGKRPGTRRLSYLEQREWDGLEAAVLEAETRAAEARRRAEDPAIAADAGTLQRRLSEMNDLQAQVDRLYVRWTELAEKQK